MTVHEAPVSATVEWYTPPGLFAALGLKFDLDPASPNPPVPWVPALRFMWVDGHTLPWEGRVWLNPPYGPRAVPFVERMIAHGNGVMLLPARTETRAFQRAAKTAGAVCFLRDRLHFIRSDGFQARSSFGSVLFAWGEDCRWAVRDAGLGWTTPPAWRDAFDAPPASASPDRPSPPTGVQTMRRTGDVRAAQRGG